ncbi:hypothetical protein [Streptomyces sp. NPDC005799]|uniref:hypothetical protein n=1 Tax=Streptomyces sp. NPDC005799 TaxID=3154678 RepID=UPI0033C37E04
MLYFLRIVALVAVEHGGTYFAQRDPERATRHAINTLNQLGYTVTLNPLEGAA